MNTNNQTSQEKRESKLQKNKSNIIVRIIRSVWRALSNNLGYKLLSLLCALMLWSYVVSTDMTITRDRTVSNVSISTTGQTVLRDNTLALLTNTKELDPVEVRVEVPQANYSRVSSDNVRVELDVSAIRSTGEYEVALKGVSAYGKVVDIEPEKVTLVVEEWVERMVPVNCVTPKEEGKWYKVSQRNPSHITISGSESLVEKVSSAQVTIKASEDMEDYSWDRAEQYVLLDANGKKAESDQLNKSTNSVSVKVEVFPTKTLHIATDIEKAVEGAPEKGYKVQSVSIEPESVEVAAKQNLLDSMSEMLISPININGATSTVTGQASIKRWKDVEYISNAQVNVTVRIVEEDLVKRFEKVKINIKNAPQEDSIRLSSSKVHVKVDGPYSVVNQLEKDDIIAEIDVHNLQAGEHKIPVKAYVDNHPELKLECDPAYITVTIDEASK